MGEVAAIPAEKPYCTCGRWSRAGFAYDEPTDLWVCAHCWLPTKLVYDLALAELEAADVVANER